MSKKGGTQTQLCKKIMIPTNDIEQFKIMLDNYGQEIEIMNTNYKKLVECKLFI